MTRLIEAFRHPNRRRRFIQIHDLDGLPQVSGSLLPRRAIALPVLFHINDVSGVGPDGELTVPVVGRFDGTEINSACLNTLIAYQIRFKGDIEGKLGITKVDTGRSGCQRPIASRVIHTSTLGWIHETRLYASGSPLRRQAHHRLNPHLTNILNSRIIKIGSITKALITQLDLVAPYDTIENTHCVPCG